ncbi:hypothetical protein [Micromonospora sp. C41]|uniref:hypothetical protein n=1 Tax=Micromonospora sp. C41 TaxID=2824878 RepID=UPI001B365652|nr:hypothetical protein [Micromonospora sp. C41]MBQ1064512.1 hypothetical protein [Micromonospora sp. C41]
MFTVTRPIDSLTELPEFCPQCFTPLPADYPFDHVAIDLALSGDPVVLRSMHEAEVAEAHRIGRERGIDSWTLRRRLQETQSQYDRWEQRWYRSQRARRGAA